MKIVRPLVSSLLLCLFSSVLQAQVNGVMISATKDSYLNSALAINYGTSSLLYAGRFLGKSTYATRRTVVEFNLSSIPSNAIVTLAKLRLNQSTSSGSPIIYTGRLEASWSETGITWANQPTYETNDLITSSSMVSGGWLEIDVQEHVQGMVAGVYDNNGWILLNNNETVNGIVSRTFHSRENSNSLLRPQLVLEYYIPIEISSALILHASSDEAEDGTISPTLAYGPGGLSYKWYNSEDSVLSTSLNLEDVPYGWYGLEVASSNVTDTFYHAFIVGVDCDEVDIEFRASSKYTSNAIIATSVAFPDFSTTNAGNASELTAREMSVFSMWINFETLLKFNLWIDSNFIVGKADLNIYGSNHASSGRNNESILSLVTERWDENIVTWDNQPSYSDSISLVLDSTLTTSQNQILDMIPFWNFWKLNDNTDNHGVQLRLIDYMETVNTQQIYHSPNAASSSDYPVINFTLDLRRKDTFLSTTLDSVLQIGSITVDLDTICHKNPPYYYMIAPDTIPDLGDLYNFTKDSIFNGSLDSLAFYNFGTSSTTHIFDSLPYNFYVVSVFDANGTRLFDEAVQLQGELEFDIENGLTAQGTEISATLANAMGSLKLYTYQGEKAELEILLSDSNPGGEQFFGFVDSHDTVTGFSNLRYGFYLSNDSLYTVQYGVKTASTHSLTGDSKLRISIGDGIIKLYADAQELISRAADTTYEYKVGVKMHVGSYINLRYSELVEGKKSKVRIYTSIVHMGCDGQPGTIIFSARPFGDNTPYAVNYVITHESGLAAYVSTTTTYLNVLNGLGLFDLLPGKYTITGTIFSTPNYSFSKIIYLGYKAYWDDVDLYTLSPNSHSLDRQVAYSSGGNLAYARSMNVLSDLETGWIEFTPITEKTINQGGNNFLAMSDAYVQPTSNYIINGDFLGFVKWASGLAYFMIAVQDPVLPIVLDYDFYPKNARFKIEFLTTGIKVSRNNVHIGTVPHALETRFLTCLSMAQDDGFKDVITSFPCGPTFDQIGYAELKKSIDAGHVLAYGGQLKFTFDEEYQIDGKYIPFKLYNMSHNIVADSDIDGITTVGTATFDYNPDDNRCILDLSETNATVGGSYLLEVTTSTKEKLFIKFIYKN